MAPYTTTTTTRVPTESLVITRNKLVINRRYVAPPLAKQLPPSSKGYTVGDEPKISSNLIVHQIIIFGSLFLGYASYTYARKIFSYAAPTLIGLSLLSQNNMGMINSAQYFAYAISKFLGGVLSDQISPKLLFPIGLFISGLSAVTVAFSSNPQFWALLWFTNGIGQGCGWPACSKLIKKWFSQKQFGTCWSLLTASSNVSGTVGPVVAAYILMTSGWKTAFIISGTISIIMGIISITLLKDSPEATSQHRNGKNEDNRMIENVSPTEPTSQTSYYELVASPLIWIVSICYLIVFATKTVLSDWGQMYLIQNLGQTQMQASAFNSALETGGFIGGILAGIVTDKLNKKYLPKGNARLLISTLFMLTCVLSLHVLIFVVSSQTSQISISLLGMICGGSLFGPISIFGIVASESYPPSISGTSHAIAALIANVGAIIAGWPMSKLALSFGWKNCFFACELFMFAAVLVIILSRNYHLVSKPSSKTL